MLSITATPSQVEQLERLVKASNTAQGVVLRSRIILLAHLGKSSKALGKTLKVSQPDSPALEEALSRRRAGSFDQDRRWSGPQRGATAA